MYSVDFVNVTLYSCTCIYMFMYMCLYITTVNMPGLEKRNLTTFQSLDTTCNHILIVTMMTRSLFASFVLQTHSLILTNAQVWEEKKVWEGFVKCCERTKPHCFSVLLQLAPTQLKSAFEIAPLLRQPLLKHVQSFTPHQVCVLHV